MVNIVCDICHRIDNVPFKDYKAKTLDVRHSNVSCTNCTQKLAHSVVTTCNYRGCSNTFEWSPYFFDFYKWNYPKKCDECRRKIKAQCCVCKQQKININYYDWNKATNEGEYDYVCMQCWPMKKMLDCHNCDASVKKNVRCQRKFNRFLCEACLDGNRDRNVVCLGKDCGSQINWLKAFS